MGLASPLGREQGSIPCNQSTPLETPAEPDTGL